MRSHACYALHNSDRVRARTALAGKSLAAQCFVVLDDALLFIDKMSRILADGPKDSFAASRNCVSIKMYTASAPRAIGCWHCRCMHACVTVGGMLFVCPVLETASQRCGMPDLSVSVIVLRQMDHSRCSSCEVLVFLVPL